MQPKSQRSRRSLIAFPIPHATEYNFEDDARPDLAEYLNDNSRYDPSTGCCVWTDSMANGNSPRAISKFAKRYGTAQAARLAWLTHYGKPPQKGLILFRACGCNECINPMHLMEIQQTQLGWVDGSIGAFKVGRFIIKANQVRGIQTHPWPPPKDSVWSTFSRSFLMSDGYLPEYVIDAIRDSEIRATRTKLPCGHVRYDLPPGITEIETDIPSEEYHSDVSEWIDMSLWAAEQSTEPMAA